MTGNGRDRRKGKPEKDANGRERGMDETIIVRRTVYEAAQKLDAEADAIGWQGFDLAEKKIGDSRAAGDAPAAEFWRDVWAYLMAASSVGAGTAVKILEDGGGGEAGR